MREKVAANRSKNEIGNRSHEQESEKDRQETERNDVQADEEPRGRRDQDQSERLGEQVAAIGPGPENDERNGQDCQCKKLGGCVPHNRGQPVGQPTQKRDRTPGAARLLRLCIVM